MKMNIFLGHIKVQYVLHLWLYTHHSSILFLTKHFIAYHNELSQQHLLFFPL